MKELERQYLVGLKDEIITEILEEVSKILAPNNHDAVKCAAFHRNILSAVNDLSDLDSENTLQF